MVKQNDPETAITVHTIRMWCKEGKIKYLTAGNKILVDVESLMDYISLYGAQRLNYNLKSIQPLYSRYARNCGKRFESVGLQKGMTEMVIPFCKCENWYKFFLYQFFLNNVFLRNKATIYCGQSGTPGGNRTHNGPLGGGCYLHLTTEAY